MSESERELVRDRERKRGRQIKTEIHIRDRARERQIKTEIHIRDRAREIGRERE